MLNIGMCSGGVLAIRKEGLDLDGKETMGEASALNHFNSTNDNALIQLSLYRL